MEEEGGAEKAALGKFRYATSLFSLERQMAADAQRDLLEHKLETLLQDALLQDVSPNPTAEEVDTLIAIEQGRAYRINVDRGPLKTLCKLHFQLIRNNIAKVKTNR